MIVLWAKVGSRQTKIFNLNFREVTPVTHKILMDFCADPVSLAYASSDSEMLQVFAFQLIRTRQLSLVEPMIVLWAKVGSRRNQAFNQKVFFTNTVHYINIDDSHNLGEEMFHLLVLVAVLQQVLRWGINHPIGLFILVVTYLGVFFTPRWLSYRMIKLKMKFVPAS